MRRRPSPDHCRAGRVRRLGIALTAVAVLVLVVVLPLDRAAVVAGLVGTVAASAVPFCLNSGRSTRRRVRGRSSNRK